MRCSWHEASGSCCCSRHSAVMLCVLLVHVLWPALLICVLMLAGHRLSRGKTDIARYQVPPLRARRGMALAPTCVRRVAIVMIRCITGADIVVDGSVVRDRLHRDRCRPRVASVMSRYITSPNIVIGGSVVRDRLSRDRNGPLCAIWRCHHVVAPILRLSYLLRASIGWNIVVIGGPFVSIMQHGARRQKAGTCCRGHDHFGGWGRTCCTPTHAN